MQLVSWQSSSLMKNLFSAFVRELMRPRGDIELTAEATIRKSDSGRLLSKIAVTYSELCDFRLRRRSDVSNGRTSSVQRGVHRMLVSQMIQ